MAVSVDREAQQADVFASVTRGFQELYKEVIRTLDKSDRVATANFEVCFKVGQGIRSVSSIAMERHESVSVEFLQTDMAEASSRVCQAFLNTMYADFSRRIAQKFVIASDFTFKISLYGAEGNLLQDRVLHEEHARLDNKIIAPFTRKELQVRR